MSVISRQNMRRMWSWISRGRSCHVGMVIGLSDTIELLVTRKKNDWWPAMSAKMYVRCIPSKPVSDWCCYTRTYQVMSMAYWRVNGRGRGFPQGAKIDQSTQTFERLKRSRKDNWIGELEFRPAAVETFLQWLTKEGNFPSSTSTTTLSHLHLSTPFLSLLLYKQLLNVKSSHSVH